MHVLRRLGICMRQAVGAYRVNGRVSDNGKRVLVTGVQVRLEISLLARWGQRRVPR